MNKKEIINKLQFSDDDELEVYVIMERDNYTYEESVLGIYITEQLAEDAIKKDKYIASSRADGTYSYIVVSFSVGAE